MSGGVDREKLIKLMRMTESNADGEALNALRLANKMLSAAGLHWGNILGNGGTDRSHMVPPSKRGFNNKPSTSRYGRAAPRQSYQGDKGKNHDEVIADWLNILAKRRHSIDFQMFLGSVTNFWEKNGYLTDAQYDAIRRAVDR